LGKIERKIEKKIEENCEEIEENLKKTFINMKNEWKTSQSISVFITAQVNSNRKLA
jgi:hypothetical protein